LNMAVPDFQTLMLPILKIAGDNNEHGLTDTLDELATEFQLTEADRAEVLKSGQSRFYNRVGWSITYLKKSKLLSTAGTGRFKITERGKELLISPPPTIDVNFLEKNYPELSDFRKTRAKDQALEDEGPAEFDDSNSRWLLRPLVEARVKSLVDTISSNEEVRLAAISCLASAIEIADEERGGSWYLKETDRGFRLMTGRVLALSISRLRARIAVLGPISEDLRQSLAIDIENDVELKHIPGGVLLTLPIDRIAEAQKSLLEGFTGFVEAAMIRVRRPVNLVEHTPEAVNYISQLLGRELQQPVPEKLVAGSEAILDDDDEGDTLAVREPRVRGRAPIFEPGQRSIASLMGDIEQGLIALPDLQRQFVWEDTAARQLLDSLFLGFPVGTLVFWHTPGDPDDRLLGTDRPGLRANILVIDGQQRLTSLYAVIKGVDVVGKDGRTRRINIAFRPRDGRFEVADAAIRNDPEFLPNVVELWDGRRTPTQIRRDLIKDLRDKGRVVDDRYEDAVDQNLGRAYAITNYRFPTVDIRKVATGPSDEITDEDVAEIFVRINNQGTRLGQADFVLTLLSVFHGELRDQIEERARIMSSESFIGVDSQQLLRAICGVGFGRARMSAIYRYLRGVDPTTGDASARDRTRRLDQLDEAAKACLETTPWRDYLLCVRHAGFVSSSLVSSHNAIINGFTFYVRGRKIGVPKDVLDKIIARWVFGTLLSARYSTSSETVFEQDLARIARAELAGPESFVSTLDSALGEVLTTDYFTHTLVAALETEKSRAPAALAFRAAQIVLGAKAFLSDQLLRNLLDPPTTATRSASELHHLFPRAWLQSRGIRERRLVNQVANLADAGWHENSVVSAQAPAYYVPRWRDRQELNSDRWGRMCAEHALPPGWEQMEYQQFLPERRRRMAEIVRAAFRQLGGESDSTPISPPWFTPGAEEVWNSIAETERTLRRVVREVYAKTFGDAAAQRIETGLSERERETLGRALRARPAGLEPLSIVDYLYLGQMPQLLFSDHTQQLARQFLGGDRDVKQELRAAINNIVPVRNEIAHIREVDRERLLRAKLACADVVKMVTLGKNVQNP
jgi:hypothetical protein